MILDTPAGKQFIVHNAIFDLGHLMHAGLEPERIECTMLQANALRGKRPSLAALAETELSWRISKEQQVSAWGAPTLCDEGNGKTVLARFPRVGAPSTFWKSGHFYFAPAFI